MKYKNLCLIIFTTTCIVSLRIQSMFRVIVSKKLPLLQPSRAKRTFSSWATELREAIKDPHFSPIETQKIISELPHKIDPCCVNELIETIVCKAMEYKRIEKKYALVLAQLREHGWSKSHCCIDTMLHSAVISDLFYVTEELLSHDLEWVHTKDCYNNIPINYACSEGMRKILKDFGSKDPQLYPSYYTYTIGKNYNNKHCMKE